MNADITAGNAWSERRQKVILTIRADSLAKMNAEAPAFITAWQTCTRANAHDLGLSTEETAEAIARATFAACRSQRDNLIALHNRYGYPGFSEIMDEAERRLLSDLMLEVMYTRKAMTAAS